MIIFTKQFFDKFKKFFGLPEKVKKLLTDESKKTADLLIKNFRDGVQNDKLSLARLKPGTLKTKRRQKMPFPNRPLVGKGIKEKNSYANMMERKKIKNGWRISPKQKLHYSKKITLRKLFLAHENALRAHTPKRPALQIVTKKQKKFFPSIEINPINFEVRLKRK